MINISHHGAVSGVTGSCHELSITSPGRLHPSAGILIDCGLFQGADAAGKSSVADLSIDFPIDHIRALVITHVHIDHVGRIPYLLAAECDGEHGRAHDDEHERECGSEQGAPGVEWQDLEVVVDSPLAAEFTRIYRQLKPMWDAKAQEVLSQGRHPLGFDQLALINSHASHLDAVEYLASFKRPALVLAGSGMCAGGRVVNYLKAMLGDARNDVLFVGYQAAGTPGRDILKYGSNAGVRTPDQAGWVELDEKRYPICARIHQIVGYSAHAGQSDLLNFVMDIPGAPREIRLVHGDDGAKAALKVVFEQALKAKPESRVVIAE